MPRVAVFLLLCACAYAALPEKLATTETKMVPQERIIAVKRVPISYFYPFSLWPMPKYPLKDRPASEVEEPPEVFKNKRLLRTLHRKKR